MAGSKPYKSSLKWRFRKRVLLKVCRRLAAASLFPALRESRDTTSFQETG